MALMLRDGDYVPDGAGGLRTVEGAEALLQEVLFRLQARQYAAEALEELDVSVDGAELTEGGDGTLGVRVYLTWRGEPLQAEVEI